MPSYFFVTILFSTAFVLISWRTLYSLQEKKLAFFFLKPDTDISNSVMILI